MTKKITWHTMVVMAVTLLSPIVIGSSINKTFKKTYILQIPNKPDMTRIIILLTVISQPPKYPEFH